MINVWPTERGSGTGDGTRRLAADGLGHADLLARGTFDALLRTVVTWELVVSDGRPGRDGWQLSAAAEERLCQLEQRTVWAAEQLVYFDHRCEACRSARPTRLVDGAYLCEHCRQPPPVATSPAADARRRGLLRRRRAADAPAEAPGAPGEPGEPGEPGTPPQELVS